MRPLRRKALLRWVSLKGIKKEKSRGYYSAFSVRKQEMTEFQDFIEQVFKEQYEASFGLARLEELEPKE